MNQASSILQYCPLYRLNDNTENMARLVACGDMSRPFQSMSIRLPEAKRLTKGGISHLPLG